MNFVTLLTDPKFLIAVFAAISAAAIVFTLGSSLLGERNQVRQRIKRVALEREKMRAEEMARLQDEIDEADELGPGRRHARPASQAGAAAPR